MCLIQKGLLVTHAAHQTSSTDGASYDVEAGLPPIEKVPLPQRHPFNLQQKPVRHMSARQDWGAVRLAAMVVPNKWPATKLLLGVPILLSPKKGVGDGVYWSTGRLVTHVDGPP